MTMHLTRCRRDIGPPTLSTAARVAVLMACVLALWVSA